MIGRDSTPVISLHAVARIPTLVMGLIVLGRNSTLVVRFSIEGFRACSRLDCSRLDCSRERDRALGLILSPQLLATILGEFAREG